MKKKKFKIKKNNINFAHSILDKGENIIINQRDSTIIIRLTDDTNDKEEKLPNISKTYLGQCKTKLKDIYGISKNDSLYIFQLEIK